MKHKVFLFQLLLLLLLTACRTTSDTSFGGELEITMVTANLTLPTEMGAVYMVITNNTDQDEVLLGASLQGCTATELHEMTLEDDVMVMRPVEGDQKDGDP